MENNLIKKELSLTSLDDMALFGKTLKEYIVKNDLSCNIVGKEYPLCDAWKFAAINFGLTPIPKKPENLSVNGGEIKYSCEVDLIHVATQNKVSYGYAVCSNKEAKKKSFDEYAIASMAQTRAIAKACRNLLGFIMNEAGYETTSAEEMDEKYVSRKDAKEQAFKGADVATEVIRKIIDLINAAKTIDELIRIYNDNEVIHSHEKLLNLLKAKKEEITTKATK